MTRWCLVVMVAALLPRAPVGAETLLVKPGTELSTVREKLAGGERITEVVFEAGTYPGGLYVEGPKGAEDSRPPLIIRAADGAKVVFEGSAPLDEFQPHETLPGVFWRRHDGGDGEPPKLWEPGTRTR